MGIIGRFAIALMPEQTPFPVSWLVDLLNRPRQMAEDDKEEEGIKACRYAGHNIFFTSKIYVSFRSLKISIYFLREAH